MVVAGLFRIVGTIKSCEFNPLSFRLKFREPTEGSRLNIKRLVHHINAKSAPREVTRMTVYPVQRHKNNMEYICYF
jgi:hypothetical protein